MGPNRRKITYSSHPNRAARAAHARGDREFRTYDTSYIRPKKSKAPMIVAVVLALAVVAVAAVFAFRSCAAQAVDLLPEGEQAVIVVEQGESASGIADSLVEARLIARSSDFVDIVKKQNAASALIPGTYVFHGGVTGEDIVKSLMAGPASTGFTLTVPEGYKRSDIADAVEKATEGLVTAEQFLAASSDASAYASDYPFLESAGSNSLEGFLFPKTYTVTAVDDATVVVCMMLDQFKIETASLDLSYPQSRDMSLYDVVKLASVVEKEAAADNRATVASVFYNRLASDRPYLESDATTAYEVGHDPTPEEVHADTPYSTYSNAGLPPTPICCPSLECLKAVCTPEQTNYLFFYFAPNSSGGMEYHFSETYEQHQDAIAS